MKKICYLYTAIHNKGLHPVTLYLAIIRYVKDRKLAIAHIHIQIDIIILFKRLFKINYCIQNLLFIVTLMHTNKYVHWRGILR